LLFGLTDDSVRAEIYLALIKISGFSQVVILRLLHTQLPSLLARLPQKSESNHLRSSRPYEEFAVGLRQIRKHCGTQHLTTTVMPEPSTGPSWLADLENAPRTSRAISHLRAPHRG
jgi:hypothetical protein